MSSIRRLLIPNRGEIALRIIRTARALGIETVLGASQVDRQSLPARMADRVVVLGPTPPRESYLSVERVVGAALATRCDAVHPGYGFLSERAELARAVEGAGLIYVGPAAAQVELLGDKLAARRAAEGAGIPVVPGGSAPLDDPAAVERLAERVGYPLLVKASAGGGGRGMRLVRNPEEASAAFRLASSEAEGAFGDRTLFAERFLPGARHVEVQVLGDGRGGVRVFPERDCSLQRRYQKVLEETPSPGVSPSLRETLLEAAGKLVSLAGYRGAGTVEFLVTPEGSFHFLEVNTRLQVEHPITEEVTGTDLVAEQIAIAEGREFPQGEPRAAPFSGWAVELRVNAEDPFQGFRPSTGILRGVRLPGGPGVRVDSALFAGLEVTPHYDPLLAKVIARGGSRQEALARLGAACEELQVEGVATTAALAAPLLAHAAFSSGNYHCQSLEAMLADPAFLEGPPLAEDEERALAVVAACLARARAPGGAPALSGPSLSGGPSVSDRAETGSRAAAPGPGPGSPSPWVQEGRRLALRRRPR